MEKTPKVLFEITEDHLETGLRGFPVGYCPTSKVDPQKGLFYREIPVSDLAKKSPEEVIYLLMEGKLPEKSELEKFRQVLAKDRHLSKEAKQAITSLPRKGHPMKLLSSAILILGMLEETGDYRKDCMNLIAKAPALVATVINYHAGWGEARDLEAYHGYMENFTEMLNVPGAPDKKRLSEVMALFNILHYDHGGGNASAFAGKLVASTLEDIYGSSAASMCALEGPRHGKANQEGLEMIRELQKELGDGPTADQVEQWIRDRLAAKKLISGFGHAVLRAEDARATIFYDYLKKHFTNQPLAHLCLMLRERATKVLKENPKIQNPYPNVDAASGTLLSSAGFNFPEYFTLLFGLSRIVGVGRQIVYERLEAREGKGVPIYRCKYIYKAGS